MKYVLYVTEFGNFNNKPQIHFVVIKLNQQKYKWYCECVNNTKPIILNHETYINGDIKKWMKNNYSKWKLVGEYKNMKQLMSYNFELFL